MEKTNKSHNVSLKNLIEFSEIVETLSKIMNKHEANILIFLDKNQEATGTEIERGLKLRQPQVSLAMKSLMEKQMVKTKIKDKGKTRGRPEYIYSIDRKNTGRWFDGILATKEKELNDIKDVVVSWRKKS